MAYKVKTSKRSVGWYAFSYSVGGKRVVKGKRKPVRTKTRALAVARRMSKTLGKKVTPVLVSSVTKGSFRVSSRRSSKRGVSKNRSATGRRTSKTKKFYLVDPNTDEVWASHGSLSEALRQARIEGSQVVIASSRSAAEDIAAGAKAGPMFWPGKIHRGHPRKRRVSKRRTSLR